MDARRLLQALEEAAQADHNRQYGAAGKGYAQHRVNRAIGWDRALNVARALVAAEERKAAE